MKYVEVIANANHTQSILAIAEKLEVSDFRIGMAAGDDMQTLRLIVADDKLQPILDALQDLLGKHAARIVVLPVEIVLPKPSEQQRKEEDTATMARETLYAEVEKNAQLDLNFIVLVLLSTAVAAIGLIENSVAVVIGAMVIAPLFGPNLAFGLGTALGDVALMRKAAATTVVGVGLAIAMSVAIGIFWPLDVFSPELTARTRVGLDSIALALASGAAGALSLTTGLSSMLVGVMVAVALLPPAVTLGLMLGLGDLNLAFSAGLLLAINIVCVNLAIKVVFFIKGVRPHTWWEKKKANRAMAIYVLVWIATLAVLVLVIYSRQKLVN